MYYPTAKLGVKISRAVTLLFATAWVVDVSFTHSVAHPYLGWAAAVAVAVWFWFKSEHDAERERLDEMIKSWRK